MAVIDDDTDDDERLLSDDDDNDGEVVYLNSPPDSTAPKDSAVDVYSSGDDEDDADTLARFSNTRIVTTSSVVRRASTSAKKENALPPMDNGVFDDHTDNREDSEDVLTMNDRSALDGLILEIERMIDRKRGLAENLRKREQSRPDREVSNESSSLLQDGMDDDSDDGGGVQKMSASDRVERICSWLGTMHAEVVNVRKAVKEGQVSAQTAREFIADTSEVLDDRVLTQYQQGVLEELPEIPLCFGDP
jgi:hypothetical protein